MANGYSAEPMESASDCSLASASGTDEVPRRICSSAEYAADTTFTQFVLTGTEFAVFSC